VSPVQRAPVSDETLNRQLEVTVLTQLRDSMALVNQNLTKLDDKVDKINTDVVSIIASRYEEQIAEVKLEIERRLTDVWKALGEMKLDTKNTFTDQETRIREHDRLLSRLGLGMAISGSVGGMALGAIVVQVLTSIFGAK